MSLPFPTPEDHLIQGSNTGLLNSLSWQADTTVPPGKPKRPLPDDKYKVAYPCSEILLDIEKE